MIRGYKKLKEDSKVVFRICKKNKNGTDISEPTTNKRDQKL